MLSTIFQVLKSNIGLSEIYRLNYAITYNCNARCKNCNIWKSKNKKELDLEDALVFLKKNNFNALTITGGEPTVKKNISQFILEAKENLKDLSFFSLTTNGLLPKKVSQIAQQVNKLKIPISIITVSIDGQPTIHNKLRGIKNAFNKALESFNALSKFSNITPQIGYTIFPGNAGTFEGFYKYILKRKPNLKANDFDIHTYNISSHFYNNTQLNNQEKNYQKLAIKDIEFYLKKLKPVLTAQYIGKKVFQKLSKDFLKTSLTPIRCKSLKTSIFLDPFGNLYPCINWDKRLINIKDIDYDLKHLKKSKQYKKILNKIQEKKCPQCWTICEATQSMLGNLADYKFISNLL